jgi:hypothetical protein
MSDPHETHPDATLSLVEETSDGGRLFQSWTICACDLPRLRGRLGPPQNESYATADAVRATAEAVLAVPGSVQTGTEG